MKIRAGYEISYDCPQPTPMILHTERSSVPHSRSADLDRMQIDPPIPANTYHDSFGNFCHVIHAPAGRLTMSTDFLVQDKGEPDAVAPQAEQHELEDLPVDVLIYLLGSRYCETDRLIEYRVVAIRKGAERLAAGAGDLRLRARSHHIRLRACEPDEDGIRRLYREARRVPGLRASRGHACAAA